MAITSPQAVAFSNEQLRVAANRLSQAYQLAKVIQVQWQSDGMAALLVNDGAEIISDGAATDGRSIVTGADAVALKAVLDDFITTLEAASNAKLLTVSKYSTVSG